MSKAYMTRTGGATVTVFVPYDCGNHCPFCINKEEYAHPEGFSVEKICESIRTLNAITPNCDFVFTGGEPLANLPSLQVMLDCVPAGHRIFINTTLPVLKQHTEDEVVSFLNRNKEKITCVNVSRHLNSYVVESSDDLFDRLEVPARINCVLFGGFDAPRLKAFIARFQAHHLPIQFRSDYTRTTPDNLYVVADDPIFQALSSLYPCTYAEGCRIRCNYEFGPGTPVISYHKTLPYSTIPIDQNGVSYDVLYDVIIKQNGDLHSDWTGVALDLDAYRAVTYEPYDLHTFTPELPSAALHSTVKKDCLMNAELLKGAPVAAALNESTAAAVELLKTHNIVPTLAIVRLGERDDDLAYERGAEKRCAALGIAVKKCTLPQDTPQDVLCQLLHNLSTDSTIHGILMFRPLPAHINEAAAVAEIPVEKDMDGITKQSLAELCTASGKGFAPCTAEAVLQILRHYYGSDFCRGKRAVIIGRSETVGLPASLLLLGANATVTVCHRHTQDLPGICRSADIVVSACGRTDSLGAEYFSPSQIVIDVGIGWSEEKQKLCGDVKTEEAAEIVSAITPVPGGVGAVTTAMLASHTVRAAAKQNNIAAFN